jgi:hypothetical protein
VQPWVDLQIAILFRRQAQFYTAISADKRVLTESSTILDSEVQEPLTYRSPADFATFLAHRRGQGPVDGYIMVMPLIGVGGHVTGFPPGQWLPLQNLRLHFTSKLEIGGIRNAPDRGIFIRPSVARGVNGVMPRPEPRRPLATAFISFHGHQFDEA